MSVDLTIFDKISLEKGRRTPQIGDIYIHFKDIKVIIVALAMNTETQEPEVVYRHNDDYWVRPLEMFLSTVDKTKYPSCEQTYRFERLLPTNITDTFEFQCLFNELKKIYDWDEKVLTEYVLDHYFK